MKKLYLFITCFLCLVSSISAQSLALQSYRTQNSNLASIRHLKNIHLSDAEITEIFSTKQALKPPIAYFLKGVYSYQKGDTTATKEWFDEVLNLEMHTVCEAENTLEGKNDCGEYILQAKKLVLKKRMYEFFELKNKPSYCALFQKYRIDVEEEYVRYRTSLFGPAYCGTSLGYSPYWFEPYEHLVMKFIACDCSQNGSTSNLSVYSGAITNRVLEYPAGDAIQAFITERLYHHLQNKGELGNAKTAIVKIIQDFKLNAQSKKGVYFQKYDLFGIPLQLETGGLGYFNYQPSQQEKRKLKRYKRRHQKGKELMSKRKIIRAFKRTIYYKLFLKGERYLLKK